MPERLLPEDFADLEPFATRWALATEAERYQARLSAGMTDIQAFYDAFFARAEDAIAYCDKFPLHELPDDALRLLHLLYSLVTVSFAVECWGQPRVPDSGAAYLDLVSEPRP
jgi:hypothetical protein